MFHSPAFAGPPMRRNTLSTCVLLLDCDDEQEDAEAKVMRRNEIATSAYRPPRNDARNRSFLVIARRESSSDAAIWTLAAGCQRREGLP